MTASDKNTADLNMDALDASLSDARADNALHPSEAFMARVLDNALGQQPMPHLSTPSTPSPWWHQITAMIGGWQGMGGLVAATCAGFWIGISPPEGLPTQFEALLNLESSQALFVNSVDGEADGGALIGFGWDIGEG